MKHFRQDNTEGYTDEQPECLNMLLALRLNDLDPDTDEYHETVSRFSDEVSRSNDTMGCIDPHAD